jgi:hypothetical protein
MQNFKYGAIGNIAPFDNNETKRFAKVYQIGAASTLFPERAQPNPGYPMRK